MVPLQRTLDLDPEFEGAYGAMGETLMRLGRTREALVFLEQAGERTGDNARVRYYQGFARLETGDAAGALPLLEEAIALNPDSADAFRSLGDAYLALGQEREALEMFLRAIDLYQAQSRPSSRELARAYFGVGNVYATREFKFPEAIRAFQNALNADPNFGLAHARMGDLLAQRQQYERANVSYQAALALEPNSPEIYNGLGELLFAMGYVDRAVAAWRQAIAIDPGYGEALTNLGNALGSGRRVP